MTLQKALLSSTVSDDMPRPPSRHPSQLLGKVWKNFDAVLSDMDFQYELSLLNISSWRFRVRKRLSEELEALTVALWRLALERSFPEDWQRILAAFMDVRRARMTKAPERQAFTNKVETYLAIIEQHRESDFTEPAKYLVELAEVDARQAQSVRLKLALHLRMMYNNLFERLF